MIMQTNTQTTGLRKTRTSKLVRAIVKMAGRQKTYNAEFAAIAEYRAKYPECKSSND